MITNCNGRVEIEGVMVTIDYEKSREYYRNYRLRNLLKIRERHNLYLSEYRKKTKRKHQKAYDNRYPEKQAARFLVNREFNSGRMKRLPCEVCGNEKAHAHHDDYSKPLEVRFLCPLHHTKHHLKASEQTPTVS